MRITPNEVCYLSSLKIFVSLEVRVFSCDFFFHIRDFLFKLKSSEQMTKSGEEAKHLLKTNTWLPEADRVLSEITHNVNM